MRKKILGIITILSIISIVGCGEQATTMGSNVESKDESIESSESTPTPESSSPTESEDGIVDSGTLEEIPDANEEGNEKFSIWDYVNNEGTRYDYTAQWAADGKNTKCEAWNDSYLFLNDSSKAFNCTYFKTSNDDVMSFTWIGPSSIGTNFDVSDSGITFHMSDKIPLYYLYAFNYGKMSDESEFMKNYDASVIMGAASGIADVNSFQIEESDEFYRVTFKVNETIGKKNYIGFDCYIDYYDINECWQFEFFVEESAFDSQEAYDVINSIARIDLAEYESIIE